MYLIKSKKRTIVFSAGALSLYEWLCISGRMLICERKHVPIYTCLYGCMHVFFFLVCLFVGWGVYFSIQAMQKKIILILWLIYFLSFKKKCTETNQSPSEGECDETAKYLANGRNILSCLEAIPHRPTKGFTCLVCSQSQMHDDIQWYEGIFMRWSIEKYNFLFSDILPVINIHLKGSLYEI